MNQTRRYDLCFKFGACTYSISNRHDVTFYLVCLDSAYVTPHVTQNFLIDRHRVTFKFGTRNSAHFTY